MKQYLRNNGLSIVFLLLFLLAMIGQIYTGKIEYNKQLQKDGANAVSLFEYVQSGHFCQSTFENWESEFLQMAMFVLLTIVLRQKGSSESKKMDEKESVDEPPSADRPGAPWPVKKGGVILSLYKHSLSLVLLVLFLLSFALHFYGSLKDENHEALLTGAPLQSPGEYLLGSRFWFESLQNWQSEFLSVFAIVVLSIYLRQIGSPQSKPVDASNTDTGE